MSAEDPVTLEVEAGAARIVLNRPETLNAWNAEFGGELRDALAAAAEDDAVRAIMITGAGRGFSSGADLGEQRSGRRRRSRRT